MGKITIYQFEIYDPLNDEMRTSRRWGTREAIKNIAAGHVLDKSATEVDESAVESDILGLTTKGFIPNPRQGFQSEVAK